MYFAHGPISYILNEVIQKKQISKLKESQHILVMIFSILFGILPDIDLALLSITNIPPFLHHSVFTHSILLYISLWILLNIFIYIFKRILRKEYRKVFSDDFLNVIQWSFLIGSLSHLMADLLFSYSEVLFPIQKQFTILGNIFEKNYFANLIFTPSFALEILILTIFILTVLRRYLKNITPFNYLIYVSIFISFTYLIFTMYMNLNIFNSTYFKVGNERVLDGDYDGILDIYDPDTNNNEILNIYELDLNKASIFVKDISNGKYLVNDPDTIQGKVKNLFGAMNSYRLISQTYNVQNLSIEPVLLQYSKTKDLKKSYSNDISYSNILYEYMFENATLISQPKYIQGNIFFVLERNLVLNMGIHVEDDLYGIVLPNDTRLILHTLEDIKREYSQSEIKYVDMK